MMRIDDAYWWCVLMMRIDDAYWWCVLMMRIDDAYWWCVLMMRIDDAYWWCVLMMRIDDAEDNEEDIWKLLARQGLISDEQFEKLSKLDNTDIEITASVLKGVQGIPFLPTSLRGLRTLFGALWPEFTKNGSEMMKNKLLPVLKVLLNRGGITDEQCSTLNVCMCTCVRKIGWNV